MSLRLLTAGESHGPALTAILDGMVAGLKVDHAFIHAELARRQSGTGAGPRMKIEQDEVQFLGGVLEGHTTGAPIAIHITNRDHARWQGKAIPPMTIPRPGHADLTAAAKYGYPDLRYSLERSSARETAVRVAAGSICKLLLAAMDIRVIGYVTAIGEIDAELSGIPIDERRDRAESSPVRCPDLATSQRMQELIEKAIRDKDTLGGVIEIVALGLPIGLGTHVQADRRLSGRLAAAVMSIQAIKGVEIGEAFALSRKRGTEAHDAIRLDQKTIRRASNHAGGLEGGITNGQPLVVRAAMKPIATTLTPQESVDLLTGAEVLTDYERSDFCPVPRAVPILESAVALVLADELIETLGGDTLTEMRTRFEALPRGQLTDFDLDGKPHTLWP